jgi:glycosyltransferase involved in cell wall biosynthesis
MRQRIAIVMPSYLGDYEGAASNRVEKFKRAVESVERQQYTNGLLIIVSDGCDITNQLVVGSKLFRNNNNIHYIQLPKQPLFSGSVRQAGVKKAIKEKADIICYLDADDVLLPTHLQFINESFNPELDWIYFNDLLYPDVAAAETIIREASLKFGFIGTSNIAHRAKKEYSWYGLDGWGHDWAFILKLMGLSSKYIKTTAQGLYVVHHIKGQFDT